MTDIHMDRLMQLSGFPELSEDAQNLARSADMAMADWCDREATGLSYLWAACQVLRSYESPAWGSTGGRYGHSLGCGEQLDVEWLARMTEGAFEEWCAENDQHATDLLGEPWAAYKFAENAFYSRTEKNPGGDERTVLEIADWIKSLIDAGEDY